MAGQPTAQSARKTTEATRQRRRTATVQRSPVVLAVQSDHGPEPALLQLVGENPMAAPPAVFLQLQRLYGNRAVGRLIRRSILNSQFSIPNSQFPIPVQRQEEEEEIQARRQSPISNFQFPNLQASGELEGRLASQRGRGQPLPDEVRAFMEPRFGADFGDVRVHTDAEAAQLSRDLHAQAFTHGWDVYFGAGRYAPETDAGKRLLAHELTHVVQQTGGLAQRRSGRISTAPAGGVQRQVCTVDQFRDMTRAGRFARRDKEIQAIEHKLKLFHYLVSKSRSSENELILAENLRILEVVFDELKARALNWIEAPGSDKRRIPGMQRFYDRLTPEALQETEKRIIIGVAKAKLGPKQRGSDVETAAEVALNEGLAAYGSYADWLGGSARDAWFKASSQENIAGGTYGLLANLLGLGMVSVSIHEGRKAKKEATMELELLRYKPKGQEDLFGAVSLLEKQIAQANKGLVTDSVAVGSAINGTVNAIVTIISGAASGATAAAAGLAGNITFAFGYGLGAIMSLVQAGRDFFNGVKRAVRRGAVANVIGAYEQRLRQVQDELRAEQNRVVGVAVVSQLNLGEIRNRLEELGEKAADLEKRRNAFAVAYRKQGWRGKITSGMLNLLGAAGGISLGVAGVAAAVGTGAVTATAAAGPVGWALAGVALVGLLAYAIGKRIKQSIRAKNVTRMRQELGFVKEYINAGTIAGKPSPAYDQGGGEKYTAQENLTRTFYAREFDYWHRFMVQPEGVEVEKKGWFNRLTSKKKSGRLKMGERQKELEDYLKRFDKEDAGEIALAGIIEALQSGPEGDALVNDPADQSANPRQIPMRTVMRNLLKTYFGKDAQKMEASLLSDDPQLRDAAGKRVLSKLKLA